MTEIKVITTVKGITYLKKGDDKYKQSKIYIKYLLDLFL